jgi:DNA segregation ATPase FtsK/SpoIIIE, S-DNA-T family
VMAIQPSAEPPILLTLPRRGCLLLETGSEGRGPAVELLTIVMARLLTGLPAGRVYLTIIDPVGLGQNFAGFMHAADYDEKLVGRRIWTEADQIQKILTELTSHMETVIQKYLRNEYETIDAYNAQAGELAEPYRFVVITDFPANINDESARRLTSILNSGPRCGVFTLIARDVRQISPPGFDIDDLAGRSLHMIYQNGEWVFGDPVLRHFSFVPDRAPDQDALTTMMHTAGRAAQESSRVEVPFETISPPMDKLGKLDSAGELRIAVGRVGAKRLQYLTLGRGVAQHVLIAGKTGSGKSTLLHVMITNLCLWYRPDQVELYLIDFKRGVEFKTYQTHHVPHIRALAIESDREFGLSILQRLNEEMGRRGELFRQCNVQDLAGYRQATGRTMPRTVLIVDEFQVFFSEDDKLAQDAAGLLEHLVRQGRAFGLHVILGSQTLGGATGLGRSTMGQMAVRIALQCSESDSQLILDDTNLAARLLSRPGEAIYNDAGGQIAGNSPFQTAWLPESRRDEHLSRLTGAYPVVEAGEEAIIFEGNQPADIVDNRLLAGCLQSPPSPSAAATPSIWLGEPVTIKFPTAAMFRRQSGANLLILGQRDDAALALLSSSLVSLAAQLSPAEASFVVLDGSPANSEYSGVLERLLSILPHPSRRIAWREAGQAVHELRLAVEERGKAIEKNYPAIFLLIYGLQRYSVLRRRDDDFSLGLDAAEELRPDRDFAELLRDGPPMGVHAAIWADTLMTAERTFNRATMREFGYQVLFQMSAGDSSHLIDLPAANKLGSYRAIFHSPEEGIIEKFRPYALPDKAWLDQCAAMLVSKWKKPDA